MNQEFVTRRGLISQGGITFPYVGVTTTYSISSDDYFIECTSSTFNVTLPTAVGIAGKIYVIKNSDTGVITVDTTSSETIDGVLTKTLNQYDSVIFESNGVNWVIVGDSGSVFSLSVDNGLSLIGATAILGGTISQNTILHGEGYDLIMSNFDNLYFTSSVFDVESDFISLDSGGGSIQIISGQDIVVVANDVLTISATSGNITTFNLEGLVYTADYNATFVTHSLIDRLYVDSLFALTGGSFYTEVTHAVLLGLIASNSLGTASNYLITDYQTVYLAPDYYVDGGTRASSASTGPVEPILVTALSCNSLEVDAYQPAWPLDTIKYDVTQQSIGSDDVSFGTIIERVDEYGNRTDYDHRNVLYKRYQSYNRATISSHADKRLAGVITDYDCTTGDVYGNGTLFLSQIIAGDIILIETSNYEQVGVKVTNVYSDVYMTVQVDSSYSGTIFSVQSFEYYKVEIISGLGPELYCDWKEVYVGQSDNSEFINRYTFNFVLEMKFFGEVMSKNNFINNHEGLLYGSGFVLSNIVFGNSSISNTIGNYSFNNTFPIGSSLNTIGDLFNSNTIYGDVNSGSQFNDNRIDNNFERNTIFGVFKSNQIGNGFTDNYINSKKQGYPQDTNRGFSFNTIGVSDIVSVIFIPKCFNQNKIMGTFRDNTIETSFYKNKIYNFFSDNKIGGNFNENQIGNIDFLGGWSLFKFRDNTIGNNFLGNTLYNSNFNNNTIGNGFNNNTIREDFYNNQIGNDFTGNKTNTFYNNQIGNDFYSNDTFTEFNNNQIGNSFGDNNFGNNTRWGWFDLSNISVRNFNLFSNSFEADISGDLRNRIIFEELVMLDVVNNKYYVVMFTRFTPGSPSTGGGGFSYERTEIDSVTGAYIGSTVYFTKTDGGSEVDVISAGVLEITSSPSIDGIYNQVSEGSYTSGFSPDGTLWNSRYTQYDSISGITKNVGGQVFTSNTIRNYFESNYILSYFGENSVGNHIGNYFYNNTIRTQFLSNNIGNVFQYNDIKDNFKSNSIGNYCKNNYIKDDFKNNEIQNNFEKNGIDYDFYSNEIQNDFMSNSIGYDFHGNKIGSYFKYNTIGNYGGVRPASFYDNVIGNYFGTDLNDNNLGNNIRTLFFGNKIGNFFSDNITFENFESNQIGNGFFQNLINDGFHSNIIGEDFEFNIMDSNFAYNNIGDEFTINVFGKNCVDNVIGNLCLLNIVGNRFDSNRIGNIFAQNTISDNFTNNNLGDLNTNNIIGVDFIGNNTGLRFQLNLIQDNFEQNNIRNNFESNYILNNFLQNDIDDDFKLNVVGTSSVYGNSANFEKNVIGHSFISNKIGQGFKSNQIKDYFLKNEIGYAFKHNVIGSYFGNDETTPDFYFPVPFSNRIKDFFNNNNIGDYFGYDYFGGGGNGGNLIGTKFNFNTIGHEFIFNITYTDQYGGYCMSNNTIGNDFKRNVIKPNFNFNTIGGGFRNNDIDSDFTRNDIPYFFYSNTIGKYFTTNNLSVTSMFNNIKDGFESNHIGDSFIGNFINIGCARNFIGDLMGSTTLGNTIGKYFIDNNIGNNFRLNTVGNKFQHNKIGNFFEGNDIDVRFQYNQIGDYFGAKQNVSFSVYTPTGNVTKEDFASNKIGNYFGNDTNYPSGSGGEDGGNLVAKSFKNNTFGDNVIFNVFDNIFQWNEFGNEIWYNALGEFCRSNKIGNLFVGNHGTGGWPNVTGNFFAWNTIGDLAGFNMIRRNFQHNKIGNRFGNSTLTGDSNKIQMNFQRNVIGDHFGSDPKPPANSRGGNYIDQDFMDNHIGNLFIYNTISESYKSNQIGNYFLDNNIDHHFMGNHIGNFFSDNNILNYFDSNKIGNNFENNTIGELFRKNSIADYFFNNNILDHFENNKIVTNEFSLNTIDSNFKQNIIETEIDSIDFTTYNGEILTYTLTTSNTGTTGTYSGLTPSGPSVLSGTGATFDVVISSGGTVSSVSINTSGKNYVTGNTFGIDGTYVGGVSVTDDVIITINNVRIPSVYATYSCHIIERYDGVKRLTYYNASDALTVTNINI